MLRWMHSRQRLASITAEVDGPVGSWDELQNARLDGSPGRRKGRRHDCREGAALRGRPTGVRRVTGSIAFIGAGRVASTLARAFVAHGVAVDAIASRRRASAEALAARVEGAVSVELDEAAARDLVFLTVPDDAIAAACASLRWRADQGVVHASGATEVDVLRPAADAGARIGGFHPLQIFSDPDGALAHLGGASVAIEADGPLDAALRGIAARLGMRAIALPPGARAAYHGGASFAASFVASLLDEAVAMWRTFGVDERQALDALLPLTRGAVASIAAKGIAGAVSGPIARGDAGIVRRHVAAFDAAGAAHGALYREFGRRQLRLALADARIDEAQADAIRKALGV